MQHVIAEPDAGDRERREIGARSECDCQVSDCEQRAAAGDEPDLSESVHQPAYGHAVDQSADGECADEQPDHGKINAEAQVQVGADIGEGAEHERAFDEAHCDHQSRPRRTQHGGIVSDETARTRGCRVAGAGDRIANEFEKQCDCRNREQCGQKIKDAPPSEEVAEDAAGGLAEQLAEDLSGQESAKNLLAALVGDDIAEEGHGQWNDPSGRQSAGKACHDQFRERPGKPAQQHQDRRHAAGCYDAGIFAETIADRADDELHRAVRQRIGGDHDRSRADADPEIGGNLWQQRIRQRQQRDGAGRAAARWMEGAVQS